MLISLRHQWHWSRKISRLNKNLKGSPFIDTNHCLRGVVYWGILKLRHFHSHVVFIYNLQLMGLVIETNSIYRENSENSNFHSLVKMLNVLFVLPIYMKLSESTYWKFFCLQKYTHENLLIIAFMIAWHKTKFCI